jgi:isoleucyl-tRNA synthetase
LKLNEEIYWVPDWAGNRWFKSWLTTLKDWCISRQRFWGIPLSVWICDEEDCGDISVIGSASELKELAGHCPEDLHRPWIDAVTWKCEKCKKGTKKRIPDILDVWLDSGSVMWAGQEVYDGHSHYDTWVPADFIIEGKDQIRGWFNSLLCSAVVSSNRKNYNACYMHGWALRDKLKMSKSKGTKVDPEDIIEGTIPELKRNKSYSNIKGVETFRFYAIGGTQPGRDLNFNIKEYTDTYKIINTIWNVYLYANEKFRLAKFNPLKMKYALKDLNDLDKWILSKTHSTIKKLTELSDKYELPWVAGELRDFMVNDVSRWYIMLNREKLDVYSDDPGKLAIMALLYEILLHFLKMLAPVNPMISEEIYLKMYKPYMKGDFTESIHLSDWPKLNQKFINKKLEEQMDFTRDLVENVRALKDENKIRLRWPNRKLILEAKEGMPEITFPEIIKQIANVKELEIKEKVKQTNNLIKAETKYCTIYLDVSVDERLVSERVTNDLVRNIQFSRKKSNYKVGEAIALNVGTNTDYLMKYVEEDKNLVADKVTAEEFNVLNRELEEEENKVYGKLLICPNKECSASLKENIIAKLKKKADVKCPYCDTIIKPATLKTITYSFSKKK